MVLKKISTIHKQKKENTGKNIEDLFNSMKSSNWHVLCVPDGDESEN